MSLLLTYSDQQSIKPVSDNYPQAQWTKLANEVQVQDLQKILGFDFYQDIIQNPASTANAALINGGTYEYNSVTYTYAGLKYVLAYLIFAQYIRHSPIKDTYGGFVKKQFEDSRETTKGEQGNLHLDYRKIAFHYWEECACFLKANSADYPYYYTDPPSRSCWKSNEYWCF